MRTAEVARRAGCSVQQVRKLERVGVLPAAPRTPSGYRSYGEQHVRCALAYRALAVATGPLEAADLLRGVHTRPPERVLSALDAAHARLDAERHRLAAAKAAATTITAEPVREVRPSDAMSVSELATALGVPASTLRHWDAVGLVVPERDERGHRRYTPLQVRDARMAHQLRLAGYRIEALREVVPHLRRGDSGRDLEAALAARDRSITARSLALLEAAVHLHVLIGSSAPQAS